jgi:hypothetical protein
LARLLEYAGEGFVRKIGAEDVKGGTSFPKSANAIVPTRTLLDGLLEPR